LLLPLADVWVKEEHRRSQGRYRRVLPAAPRPDVCPGLAGEGEDGSGRRLCQGLRAEVMRGSPTGSNPARAMNT